MTNAYLELAVQVLSTERRPLSPRAILGEAYKLGIVPTNLHGKDQHKTLQARMSEDIVSKRERSRFFRTSPGKYFLRDFLDDDDMPDEYKQPFYSRRRLRELVREPVLAIMCAHVGQRTTETRTIDPTKVRQLLVNGFYAYVNPRQHKDDVLLVRPFVCVFKGSQVLTYRVGRYRDDRDNFMMKRSIGFSTLVTSHDQTLFNTKDAGILDAGVRATMIDLDMISHTDSYNQLIRKATLHQFVLSSEDSGSRDLLAVVSLRCPTWFEPFRRRLALNDLEWMDIRARVNDIDDFDPWSRSVLDAFYRKSGVFGRYLDN